MGGGDPISFQNKRSGAKSRSYKMNGTAFHGKKLQKITASSDLEADEVGIDCFTLTPLYSPLPMSKCTEAGIGIG